MLMLPIVPVLAIDITLSTDYFKGFYNDGIVLCLEF